MSPIAGKVPAPFSAAPTAMVASMGMDMSARFELRPSAVLVASMQLLALSSMELEQVIDRELAENVALERLEESSCLACGGTMPQSCPICGDWGRGAGSANRGSGPEQLIGETPGGRSPLDRLLGEVRSLIGSEDLFVAEYLIGSLDERGLLDEDTDEIAGRLAVDRDRVHRVLAAIREVSPAGLGARNVRELLLLQLHQLERDGVFVPPACRSIVESHLDALARGRFAAIARELATTEVAVLEARDFLREHVRPYVDWDAPHGPGEVAVSPPPLVPDVVIRERASSPGEYEIEVVESARLGLRIDPAYKVIMNSLKDGRASRAAGVRSVGAERAVSSTLRLSTAEQRHVRSQVSRARFFLSRLQERWDTLLRVATYTAERQRGFLRDGPTALEPLTRAEVACALRLHESTVSRASSGKYAMLPSGKVIPFRDFFDASLPAREELRHIIEVEDRPLSDGELAARMRDRGFPLARRTITKYRQRLEVLPRSLR